IKDTALTVAVGTSVLFAIAGFWFARTLGPRFGERQELARATAVMLLALPGIALYRVSNALSRGMAVMHHDIYSRGLTESLGTAGALLGALGLGIRDLAPEIAAIIGTLASGLVAFFLAHGLLANQPHTFSRSHQPELVQNLIRASAPIALYDLLNLGVMHIDVIMLGWF